MAAAAVAADDVDVVRQRMISAYGWPSSLDAFSLANITSTARQLASTLLANGTWPDVNYNDSQDRTIWATSAHMNRVSSMSAALSIPNASSFNDPALLASTRLALNAWYTNDWTNVNWWWDIIYTPQVHSIVFLMLDTLPKSGATPFPTPYELSRATTISLRATWWNASLGYEVTGANLAWMVQAQLMRGAWPSAVNMSALSGGFTRLWQEVKVVDWDPSASDGSNQGIQVDGSYHMHGPQLQVASYGQDYTNDMLQFLGIASGTQWSMPQAATDLLCTWMTEGVAWTSTGMGIDWAACGRQVSRNSWPSESRILIPTRLMRSLASVCSPAYSPSLFALADRVDDLPNRSQLTGHKAFWTSDYAVMRRQNWTAAWHGHSTRSLVNECGNGENLSGMYEAQGVLNVFSTACDAGVNSSAAVSYGPVGWGCGMEYATIFPLLDWNVLNGATSLLDLPVPPDCSGACCWTKALGASESRPFVGSVSDGSFGVSAFDTSYIGLTARKGYFFFDFAIIAVGANVSYTGTSGSSRVGTGLASRFMKQGSGGLTLGWTNGSMTTSAAVNASLPAGALAWAWADGVGWVTSLLPTAADAPPVQAWAGARKGNWSDIGPYPGTMQGNTLSLSVLHGEGSSSSPLVNTSFSYMVLPDAWAGPAWVASVASDPLGRIGVDTAAMVNTAQVQAMAQVSPTTLVIEAIFWQPGTFVYSPSSPSYSAWARTITVDEACLLTYRQDVQGNATVAVSNPDTPGLTVQVTISSMSSTAVDASPVGGTCASLTFTLNPTSQPNYLGQSSLATCTM